MQRRRLGLNLCGKRNDRFWFSFFHEAGHLLLNSKKETYIDVDSINDPREQRANQFAASVLIPPARGGELAILRTEAEVEAFARSIGIAPGIVVGRLQHDGINRTRTTWKTRARQTSMGCQAIQAGKGRESPPLTRARLRIRNKSTRQLFRTGTCLGQPIKGGLAALCRGSVRFLSDRVELETLRRLLQMNDGLPVV